MKSWPTYTVPSLMMLGLAVLLLASSASSRSWFHIRSHDQAGPGGAIKCSIEYYTDCQERDLDTLHEDDESGFYAEAGEAAQITGYAAALFALLTLIQVALRKRAFLVKPAAGAAVLAAVCALLFLWKVPHSTGAGPGLVTFLAGVLLLLAASAHVWPEPRPPAPAKPAGANAPDET